MSAWGRAVRSLRGRWMLALLAVCVGLIVLVTVAIRSSTAYAFEDYVVAQAFSGMQGHVEEYVRETGSLRGFVPPGRGPRSEGDTPRRPPSPVAREGPPARGEGDPRLTPPPRAGAARFPAQRGDGRVAIKFGLADEDGRLVLPMEGAPVGTVLSPNLLATGQPLLVDGVRVGTAFIPDAPFGDADPFPPGTPEAAFLRTTSLTTVAVLAGALAGALVLVWALTGRVVRPLHRLTEAAQAIAEGDLDQRVGAETDDEVGQLAAAFNAMSAKLAEATALRRQLTADVAHDLRTPLSAVLATLESIRDGTLPATPERLAAAHAEADRLGRLVGDLHTLALADAHEVPVQLEAVSPREALRHLALTHEAAASRAGIAIVVEDTAAPAVRADTDRLAQALGNLITNALRHTPPGGRVTLQARPEGGGVALRVRDTGTGIAPGLLPRVFERSVRGDTSRTGEGSGLGLSITRALAEAMGGRAEIASVPGEGTTAWIWLRAA